MSSAFRRISAILCALVLAVGLLPDSVARADDPATVVLLQMGPSFPDEAWPEAEQRVAAELSVAGLMVLQVPAQSSFTGARVEELGQVAERHGAVGAMVLVRRQTTGDVRVWIRDRVTGKTTLREVEASDLRGPDAAAVAALRVVELLHASLLEIRIPERPPQPQPVPDVVERMVASTLGEAPGPGRFRLFFGPIVAGSRHRVWPMGGLILGAGLLLEGLPLTPTLEIAAAPLSTTVQRDEGLAQVGVGMARAHVLYEPLRDAAISPGVGLGGGLLVTWALGDAEPPYESADDVTVVSILSLRLRLAVHLSGQLSGLIGLSGAFAFPAVRVRFAGEEVVEIGRPMLDGFVGIEWRL